MFYFINYSHTNIETFYCCEVNHMGRDEHRKARGKRFLAQTPKNQIADGVDVEFSEELADTEDKEAMARMREADERNKR